MLPELIGRGEITKDNLGDWPLFDMLRGEPGFRQLLADEALRSNGTVGKGYAAHAIPDRLE